jgi:hypothetical protein
MTTMTAAQLREQTGLMERVPDPEVPERPRPPGPQSLDDVVCTLVARSRSAWVGLWVG